MTSSDDDPWLPLRSHLANHTELSKLGKPSIDNLIAWLESSGPFQDLEQLRTKLLKSKIKGLNKQQRVSLLDSLQMRIMRRPFLATLGLASTATFAVGMTKQADEKEPSSDSDEVPIRRLLATIQGQQLSVGEAVAEIVNSQSASPPLADSETRKQFLHALDMSNWLEASFFLSDPAFRLQLRTLTEGTSISGLFEALEQVREAWQYLQSTRKEWEKAYFVAYALGKMPALSTASASQPAVPNDDPIASQHSAALFELSTLFHALEIFNQRFQKPGRTQQGAPVRFTQGHNFSYAHLAEDLRDSNLFDSERQTILVNWDAHADLGGPFENPRMLLGGAFELLKNAKTYAQRVVASSSMSIAGWILPLIQQGLLDTSENISKIVWVVPKEAQLSSNNYMEPYGEYSFVVGEWLLPASKEEIAEQSSSSIGDWNVPGSTEIRKFGGQPMLRSVANQELLKQQHQCKLYLVDPDDLSGLADLVGQAQIALSIDADFSGTREPGLIPRTGYLPHYPLTESKAAQSRHKNLLGQLAKFVATHDEQVRTISIANSPNFTVNEDTRKPVAQILKSIFTEDLGAQPAWIANEMARVAPTGVKTSSDFSSRAMAVGGISGIALTAGLLIRENNRLRKLRELLFAASGKSS